MTTLQLVRDHSDRNREITLRIKERLGRGDLSRTDLAEMTGLNRSTISRRLSGGVWQLDELEIIADALRIRWNWLVTGEGDAESPHPDGPDGGIVRHQGLEPRTRWYVENTSTGGADVVPLRPTDTRELVAA